MYERVCDEWASVHAKNWRNYIIFSLFIIHLASANIEINQTDYAIFQTIFEQTIAQAGRFKGYCRHTQQHQLNNWNIFLDISSMKSVASTIIIQQIRSEWARSRFANTNFNFLLWFFPSVK